MESSEATPIHISWETPGARLCIMLLLLKCACSGLFTVSYISCVCSWCPSVSVSTAFYSRMAHEIKVENFRQEIKLNSKYCYFLLWNKLHYQCSVKVLHHTHTHTPRGTLALVILACVFSIHLPLMKITAIQGFLYDLDGFTLAVLYRTIS